MTAKITLSENSKITITLAVMLFGVAAWATKLDSKVDVQERKIEQLEKLIPEIGRSAERANIKLDLLLEMQQQNKKHK